MEERLDIFPSTKLKADSYERENYIFIYFPVPLDILQIDNLWQFENLTKLQLDNNIIEKIEALESLVHLVWLGKIRHMGLDAFSGAKQSAIELGCHIPSQTRLIGAFSGKPVSCLCVSSFDCQMSKGMNISIAKQSFKCLKTWF